MTKDKTVTMSRELAENLLTEATNQNWSDLNILLNAPSDSSECRCRRFGKNNPHWPCPVHPIAAPVVERQPMPSEAELIANGLGYPIGKEDAVKLHFAGIRSGVITILEAWDAIGHDIGCNPSKEELLDSLRNMAAICDAHDNDMPEVLVVERQELVALSIPEECPHLIVFDDAEREDLMFSGAGARSAALKTWEQISMSWNAHMFVRVERNSRDDRYPSASTSPPAPVVVVLPERRVVNEGDSDADQNSDHGWNACLDKVKETNR